MTDLIILAAVPVFVVLMAVEWCAGARAGRSSYRLDDSLGSLAQGLLSQAVAACTQLFQIGLYTVAFRHIAVVQAAGFWRSAWGWLAAIVLFDFCDYWLHRVGHETAVFWAAHVVHHQSDAFNFSTALRQESLVAVLGWPFYLPLALLGVPPAQFAVAGLVVLIYQFWIHTEHIGKLGWFDGVFSSPSNHRVHHAVNPQYINRNYGGMLVVWDRLFGTYAVEGERCIYGTQTPLESRDPAWAVLQVYALLARDAWGTRRWRDKLRIWWMPTGWRPADVSARWPRPEPQVLLDLQPHPPLRRPQAVAATSQFVFAAVATGLLLWQADALPWLHALGACAAVVMALWIMGRLLEDRGTTARTLLLNTLPLALLAWSIG